MKILQLIDGLGSGGKERQCVELVKGLAAHKDITIQVVMMSEEVHYSDIYDLGVDVVSLIRKGKYDFSIFFKLYKLCKIFRPHIIHSWSAMTSVYAIPVAKMLGIRLVNGIIRDASLHGKFNKSFLIPKLTFPFSDVIVANSAAGLAVYKVPKQRGLCIYNGFDFERIENLQSETGVRKALNIQTKKVVGMVASFSRFKDYETFIEAAKIVLRKRNDVTFLAIGDGPILEKAKRSVSPNLQQRVVFPGRLEHVESVVNVFHVGVLSTHSEGISNSIMEYMALGKPVVATDSGGNNALVVEGKTGFLVPTSDADQMAHRIEQLLKDNELARLMGAEGKQRIAKEFSPEKMTKNFLSLYKEVAGK